jgi:DNA-binding MarR family transcriptional regulator
VRIPQRRTSRGHHSPRKMRTCKCRLSGDQLLPLNQGQIVHCLCNKALRSRSTMLIGMANTLDRSQLRAYFALTEAASLLQYAVRQQLQDDGGLSYVQFEILAKLADADQGLTMTALADGVVYSRSGLTHQAGLLEQRGLITRATSPEDQRAIVVDITEQGRARVAAVLPGHVQLVRELLFDSLTSDDVRTLGDMMTKTRDHMRRRPPRSAAPRKRRAGAA